MTFGHMVHVSAKRNVINMSTSPKYTTDPTFSLVTVSRAMHIACIHMVMVLKISNRLSYRRPFE